MNVLWYFTADRGEGDQPVIRCSTPITFLNNDATNAHFQSSGVCPGCKEAWKMNGSAGVIELAIFLRFLEKIYSNPVTL